MLYLRRSCIYSASAGTDGQCLFGLANCCASLVGLLQHCISDGSNFLHDFDLPSFNMVCFVTEA